MSLTWRCTICGKERPDKYISVHTRDSSSKYKLPPGTMKENIKYCSDNPICKQKAMDFSYFKEGE